MQKQHNEVMIWAIQIQWNLPAGKMSANAVVINQP